MRPPDSTTHASSNPDAGLCSWLAFDADPPHRDGSDRLQSFVVDSLLTVPPYSISDREAMSASPTTASYLSSTANRLTQTGSFIQTEQGCALFQCQKGLSLEYTQQLEVERQFQGGIITEQLGNIQELERKINELKSVSLRLAKELEEEKKSKEMEQLKRNCSASLDVLGVNVVMRSLFKKLGNPTQLMKTEQDFENYLEGAIKTQIGRPTEPVKIIEALPIELAINAISAVQERKIISCTASVPVYDLGANSAKSVTSRVTFSSPLAPAPEYQIEHLSNLNVLLSVQNYALLKSQASLAGKIESADSTAVKPKRQLATVKAQDSELGSTATQAAEAVRTPKLARTLQTALEKVMQTSEKLSHGYEYSGKAGRKQRARQTTEQALPKAKKMKSRR